MTTEELTALWAAATCITEPPSDTTITAWDVAIDLEWPKIRAALLQGESLQAENARLTSEVARLREGLTLAWALHLDKETHLGLERWSGFEKGCIPCVCALVLGRGMDRSPTVEEMQERRKEIAKVMTTITREAVALLLNCCVETCS